MGGPSAKSTVAIMPDVQKELKMTRDQKKQLQDAMMHLSPDTIQMTGDMSSINDATDAKALASLDADQLARLDELWIQYNGAKVLTLKSIADKLVLTADQSSKIKDIWDTYSQVLMDGMQHARSQGAVNALKKKKQEANDAALALLTPDQAKSFAAMQGKPFKFQQKNDL